MGGEKLIKNGKLETRRIWSGDPWRNVTWNIYEKRLHQKEGMRVKQILIP